MKNLNHEFGIVTGAVGFLGTMHSEIVLKNRLNLIMLDVNLKKLKSFSKNLKQKYPNKIIKFYKVDVSKVKDILSLKKKIKKKRYKINLIINNACIDPKPTRTKINSSKNLTENWDKELNVSLKGSVLMIETFSESMIKYKKGKIINIASDLSVIAPDQRIYKNGYNNFQKPVTYSIIKHGIVGLTKFYASKFGKYNITCNAVSPSGVYNNHEKNFVKKLTNLIPMKRMANKDDIKHVINFLISDKQKYLTGQNIIVDGGRTII